MAPLQYSGQEESVTDPAAPRPQSPPYQLFMLILCVLTLVGVAIQVLAQPTSEVKGVLQVADAVACALFFADFLLSLHRAPDRWRYMYTWGWLDLVSSIPVFDMARWGRAARVARLLRLLRGLRATMLITQVLLGRRRESATLAAGLILLLLLVSASVMILMVEITPEANIKTAEDAIWWSMTTITTVGYGDRYPVTTEGRLIAAMLMAAGVGLFGVLSGVLASWFMEGSKAAEQRSEAISDLKALQAEIRELRAQLPRQP